MYKKMYISCIEKNKKIKLISGYGISNPYKRGGGIPYTGTPIEAI
jgi:hypothetical protein